MFRGGSVSSYGNGIASGLADGGMPSKRGFVDGPGGYAGEESIWNKFKNWTSRNVTDNSGITGAEVVEGAKWMQDDKKIYGPSSPYGNKPNIQELVGDGRGVGRNIDENDPLLQYLYASGDDPASENTDVFMKEWVNEDAIKENELKAEHKESGSELPYETWKAIENENKAIEQAETNALTLGGSGGKESLMPGVNTEPKGNVNNQGNLDNEPSRYEINADDVRAQAALFDELLNEGYEKDLKSARISDASDYALKFFQSTVGEGKGIKEAAGDVAGRALAAPSRTERVQEGKKKTKQTATVMAINEALASNKSDRELDKMFAKMGLDEAMRERLIKYKSKIDQESISFDARLKDASKAKGKSGKHLAVLQSAVEGHYGEGKFQGKLPEDQSELVEGGIYVGDGDEQGTYKILYEIDATGTPKVLRKVFG